MRTLAIRISMVGMALLLLGATAAQLAHAQRPTLVPTPIGGRPTLTPSPDTGGRPTLTQGVPRRPPGGGGSPGEPEEPTVNPNLPTAIVVPTWVLDPDINIPGIRPSETLAIPTAVRPAPPTSTPRPRVSGGGGRPQPQPSQEPVVEEPTAEPEPPTPEPEPPTPTEPPRARSFECAPWSISFPVGAIANDATISCQPYLPKQAAQPFPADFALLGKHVTDITVRDAGGAEIPILNQRFTLCYSYADADITATEHRLENIVLHTAPFSGTWSALQTQLAGDRQACSQGNHLTLFAPLARIIPPPWYIKWLPWLLGLVLLLLIIALFFGLRALLRRQRINKLRRLLEGIYAKDDKPPPSMTKVAQQLDYDQDYLYSMVPDLSHAISERYLAHQHAKGAKRNYPEEVQEITYSLHAQGLYPSCDAITERLGKPWYVLSPDAIALWRKALKKLGWEK